MTPDEILKQVEQDLASGSADFDSTISLLSQLVKYGGLVTSAVASVRSWAEDSGFWSPAASATPPAELTSRFNDFVRKRDSLLRAAMGHFATQERSRAIKLVAGTFPEDLKLASIQALDGLELTEKDALALARSAYSQRPAVVRAAAEVLSQSTLAFSLVALELMAWQRVEQREELTAAAGKAASRNPARQELLAFLESGPSGAESLSSEAFLSALTLPLPQRARVAQLIAEEPRLLKNMSRVLTALDKRVREDEAQRSAARAGDFMSALRDRVYEMAFIGSFDIPPGLADRAFRQVQLRTGKDGTSFGDLLDVCPEARLLQTARYFLEPGREDKVDQLVACLITLGRRTPAEVQQFRERILELVARADDLVAAAAVRALLARDAADAEAISRVLDRFKVAEIDGLSQVPRALGWAAPRVLGARVAGMAGQKVRALYEAVLEVQGKLASGDFVLSFLESLPNPVQYRAKVELGLRLLDATLDCPPAEVSDDCGRLAREMWQFVKRALAAASAYGRFASREVDQEGTELDPRVADLIDSCMSSPTIRETALQTYPEVLEGLNDVVALGVVQHLLFHEPLESAQTLAAIFDVTVQKSPHLILGSATEVAAANPTAFQEVFLASLVSSGRDDLVRVVLEALADALGKAENQSAMLSAEKDRGTGSFAAKVGATVRPLLDKALEAARGNEALEAQYRLITFRLQEEGLLADEEQLQIPATLLKFARDKANLEQAQLRATATFPPRIELPEGRFPSEPFREISSQLRKYAYTPGVVPANDRAWFVALLGAIAERVPKEDLLAVVAQEVGRGGISATSDPGVHLIWDYAVRQMDEAELFHTLGQFLSDTRELAREDAKWLLLWALEVRSSLVSSWPDLPGQYPAVDLAACAAERLASVTADVRAKMDQLKRLHDDLWKRVARELGPVFTGIESVLYGYHCLRAGLAAEGWEMVERQLAKEVRESDVRPELHQVVGVSSTGRYRVRSSGLILKGEALPAEKAILEAMD